MQGRFLCIFGNSFKGRGYVKRSNFNPALEKKILERHDYIQIGGHARSFRGANAAVGILIVHFESKEKILNIADNLDKYLTVVTEW